MTVADLIAAAMRLTGVLAQGETPSSDESTDVFSSLNLLLEEWSAEQLIYTVSSTAVALAPGAATGTMARPIQIRDAAWKITASNLQFPVDLISSAQYAAIQEPTLQAQVIQKVYCDYANPTSNLTPWPVPSANGLLILHYWAALTQFASTADTISLPAGYIQALKYNLAVSIAPEFGVQADPAAAAIAGQSKAALKALSAQIIQPGSAIPAPQVIPGAPPQQ